MKKLSIIAITFAALAIAACTPERAFVPSDSGTTTITATRVSTRSSLGTVSEQGTDIYWDAPDRILVGYAGTGVAEFTSTNESPVTEATFRGTLPDGSGSLYGIYPATSGNTVSSDGSFSIIFKAEQTAVPGSFDPEAFPAVAVSESRNLSFRNVFGLLELQVGYDDVTKISLSDEFVEVFDDTTPAPTRAAAMNSLPGGIFTVVLEEGEPAIEEFSDMVTSIVLKAPKGKAAFSKDATYYMALPPYTFAYRPTFKLYRSNGETVSISLDSGQSVERGCIHPVITLFSGEIPDEPSENPENQCNGYEYVDLDLPSGTLWATKNVGASSPAEKGDYFAWAEVSRKQVYNWASYKWIVSGESSPEFITKYSFADKNYFGIWYNDNGIFFGDGYTTLEACNFEDDAATYQWGDPWHTPSRKLYQELMDNTNNYWIDDYDGSGVGGYKFESKKDESKFIFMPVTGVMADSGLLDGDRSGKYWTSSLYVIPFGDDDPATTAAAYEFSFNGINSECFFNYISRYFGDAVRAVIEPDPKDPYGSELPDIDTNPSGVHSGHEYVDLGLPSGNMWATCDIGASNSLHGGNCFPWAGTEIRNGLVFEDWRWTQFYDWVDYKWMAPGYYDWTGVNKYTFADGQTEGYWYLGSLFAGDGKTTLSDYGYADDPARQLWGGSWRTPSVEDFEELIRYTDITLRDPSAYDEDSGVLFTSQSNPDKFIVLPLYYYVVQGALISDDYYPFWTSALSESKSHQAQVFYLRISDGEVKNGFRDMDRYKYCPVRPVFSE